MFSLNSRATMSFIKGTIFIKIKALFTIWLTLYSPHRFNKRGGVAPKTDLIPPLFVRVLILSQYH